MSETTAYVTIARGPRGALVQCQRCDERIELGPGEWLPTDHPCDQAAERDAP